MNQPIIEHINTMKNFAESQLEQSRTVPLRAGLRPSIMALLIIGSVSCGGDDSSSDNGGGSNFTEHAALITNVANIMDAGFTQTATSTALLQTSINAYCDTVTASGEGDPTARTNAQNTFTAAMNDLQHSLEHVVGPALDTTRGTKVLYSWPLTSTCRIDEKQAANDVNVGGDVTIRGIDAIEYLLYVDTTTKTPNSCATQTTELTAFDALSLAEKQLRRCDYMVNVIADAVSTADTLKEAWNASAPDNYVLTMTSTTNATATLNDVTDAMYYLASVVKDNKLDQPMGGDRTLTPPSCGQGSPCAVDVESPNAKISLSNLRNNTLAFQKLFFGGDPADKASNVGFDDWLEAEDGNRIVADKMDADLVELLTSIDALEVSDGTLFDAINNNITAVNTLFDGPFQSVSRAFRDTVLPTLGLNLPQGSQADMD